MFMKAILPCLTLAAINIIGAVLSNKIELNYPWGISVLTSGAFVFFLLLNQPSNENSESKLRSAIAGAVVVQYLVLVGTVACFENGPDKLPPITQTLITSFTTIVGIVIAFYFGSSAYVAARRKKKIRREPVVNSSSTI